MKITEIHVCTIINILKDEMLSENYKPADVTMLAKPGLKHRQTEPECYSIRVIDTLTTISVLYLYYTSLSVVPFSDCKVL